MDCSLPGSSVHGILQAKYWNGLPLPSGDLPNPGIKPVSPALRAYSLSLSHQGSPINKQKSEKSYDHLKRCIKSLDKTQLLGVSGSAVVRTQVCTTMA